MMTRVLAVALVALTVFVLVTAGALMAVLTGLAALNVLVLILGVVLQRRRSSAQTRTPETPPPAAATRRITARPTEAFPASSEVSQLR
jgi:hypothetical protein